jgi:hypothetical protein
MRLHVLALVLLVGCAGAFPDPQDGPPSADLRQTVDQVRGAVNAAGALGELICEMQTSSSALCDSLRSSWKLVELSLGEVDKLYEVYLQTGLGAALVYAAVENVVIAIRSLRQNAEAVRSIDAYRLPAPGGVPGGASQPPKAVPPAELQNPYHKSLSTARL